MEHNVSFDVAKVVIVDPDNHVLILWRSKDDPYKPGKPDFPGGSLEGADETHGDAAVRETLEEAGIDLGGVALTHVCEVTATESSNGRVKRIARTLLAAYLDHRPAVTTSDEHGSHGWLPVDEARTLFAPSDPKHLCLARLAAGLHEHSNNRSI